MTCNDAASVEYGGHCFETDICDDFSLCELNKKGL